MLKIFSEVNMKVRFRDPYRRSWIWFYVPWVWFHLDANLQIGFIMPYTPVYRRKAANEQ